MSDAGRKTVFIFITHGFHVRNILYTNILGRLAEKCNVVIFCPREDLDNFKKEFEGGNVSVEAIFSSSSRFEKMMSEVRRYLFTNPARNKTNNIFILNMRKEKPVKYYLLITCNNIFGRFRVLRELWIYIERLFVNGAEYERIFNNYKPNVVLTATYGTQPDEIRFLRCAKRMGVKSISIVPSWDNLSSKGIIGERPDKIAVWGDVMKTEAIEIHDYHEDDILIAGAPQFDWCAHKELFKSRDEFCTEMGLDPKKKIICYGTITPKYFPHNTEIIEILADCIRRAVFSYPCQVLVRLHPQVVDDGIWSDKLSDYLALEKKYPFIRCDIPKVKKWNNITPPDRADGLHLAELLYHSDVCLNPGSTLTVDAAIEDTPVIGIGFDGHKEKPYENSIRRWYDFTYYKPVIETGGVRIAHSKEDLVSLINAYLGNHSMDREGRKKIIDIECYKIDGKAGERIANYLLK